MNLDHRADTERKVSLTVSEVGIRVRSSALDAASQQDAVNESMLDDEDRPSIDGFPASFAPPKQDADDDA